MVIEILRKDSVLFLLYTQTFYFQQLFQASYHISLPGGNKICSPKRGLFRAPIYKSSGRHFAKVEILLAAAISRASRATK